jgi:hypothetical protein
MNLLKISVFIILYVTIFSCGKSRYNTICKSGIFKEAGITTYQYGSHILTDAAGKTLLALDVKNIQPDSFLNKNVNIEGTYTEGYPIDGGPDFITLTHIEKK